MGGSKIVVLCGAASSVRISARPDGSARARNAAEQRGLAQRRTCHVGAAVKAPGDFPGGVEARDDLAIDVAHPRLIVASRPQ